jgi:hypothetical protein
MIPPYTDKVCNDCRLCRQGHDWYLSQFPPLGTAEIGIEKSPSYFVTPGKAVRGLQKNIETTIILCRKLTFEVGFVL